MKDKSTIIEIIKKRHGNLSLQEIKKILPCLHLKMIRKGEILTSSLSSYIVGFYVVKGLFRVYHVDSIQQESTFLFIKEHQIFGDVNYLFNIQDSTPPITQALEDGLILWADINKLLPIISHDINLRNHFTQEIYQVMGQVYKLYQMHLSEKPELRYLKFIEENQDIIGRLNQKHIASYLGITPESFSRLKSRILLKKKTKTV